ncbi:MAG: pyridoxamine kinase [Clostridia bacterium]|nr:pyridoxamine kinase [Clostridia bacterium]
MEYKRVLSIQDVSCFGQCSQTVALPIISAMGVETAIIPSAVLSTHTYKFDGFTFKDLTDEIPAIAAHWKKKGVNFDGVYTGYIGNVKQFEMIEGIIDDCKANGGIIIIDPVMADNGIFYPLFDQKYADRNAEFCRKADVILPNITEACFLVGYEYKTEYDETYILGLLKKLATLGVKEIVLTGVTFEKGKLGVAVYDALKDEVKYYFGEHIDKSYHGTGDVYSATVVGGIMKGLSVYESAALAVDYTVRCIKATYNDDAHWYGVEFEKEIPYLVKRLYE